AGSLNWNEVNASDVAAQGLRPDQLATSWPPDDDERKDREMRDDYLPRFRQGHAAERAWRDLAWFRAPDAWVEQKWARHGGEITAALESLSGWWARNTLAPVVSGGALSIGLGQAFDVLLAPTEAGWEEYLQRARASGLAFGDLQRAADFWWG